MPLILISAFTLLLLCPTLLHAHQMSKSDARTVVVDIIQRGTVSHLSPAEIRQLLNELNLSNIDMTHVLLSFFNLIEIQFGTLNLDNESPTLYYLRGILLNSHNIQRRVEGLLDFERSLEIFEDEDTLNSIALAYTFLWKLESSMNTYKKLVNRGNMNAMYLLLKIKGWLNSWDDYEYYGAIIEKYTKESIKNNHSFIDFTNGLEYTYLSGEEEFSFCSGLFSDYNCNYFNNCENITASYWISNTSLVDNMDNLVETVPSRRLKVGFISSDFGYHTMVTLVRGFLEYIDTKYIEVFCFSKSNVVNWFTANITLTVDHFVLIHGLSSTDAAKVISARQIDILIDLNGYTLNSGLEILEHRVAPVQISFLGCPKSTGLSFIDYVIGDNFVISAEMSRQFNEHYALLPPSYIVNDYNQLRGDALHGRRSSRETFNADVNISIAPILFGTMANNEKLDPTIFHVWMNILTMFPKSKILMINRDTSEAANPRLKQNTKYFGISSDRYAIGSHIPWSDHLPSKSAFDLVLDTLVKNSHSAALDPIWVGVPTISFSGLNKMQQRAGESIAAALEFDIGIVYSVKENEEVVHRLLHSFYQRQLASKSGIMMRNGDMIQIFRMLVQRKRLQSSLFNTKTWSKSFERLMQCIWEMENLSHVGSKKKYHVISINRPHHVKLEPSAYSNNMYNLQSYTSSSTYNDNYKPILLYFGNHLVPADWIHCNTAQLNAHHNATVTTIYASFGLSVPSLSRFDSFLTESWRVLLPNGIIMIALVDFDSLKSLSNRGLFPMNEHQRMHNLLKEGDFNSLIYRGGGYTFEYVHDLLLDIGFCDIERLGSFQISLNDDIFTVDLSDNSVITIQDEIVSLNILAKLCEG